MIRLRALPIIGVLALGACADTPTEPVAKLEARGGTGTFAAQADGADTYLIQFKREGIPSGFAASVAQLGGEVVFAHAKTGFAVVRGIDGAGAGALGMRSDVADVDADAYTTLEDSVVTTDLLSADAPATALSFRFQWNMGAIHAPEAWAKGQLGKPSVKIGFLDTGIDYLHPEFAGILNLDLSRSFVVDSRVPAGVNPIADFNSHGTLVASLAASNAVFTAGVASKVTLVSLKVCNAEGCPLGATLEAVLYAADKGLDVINLSLGGTLRRSEAKIAPNVSLIRLFEKVFTHAYARGTTIVVAAGNSALDMDADADLYDLFCEVRKVICVSSTGPTFARFSNARGFFDIENIDAPSVFTNFGRNVTVAAPGGNQFIGGARTALVVGACSGFLFACRFRTGQLAGNIGTSMAAPHVAGLAALLAGEMGRHPNRIAKRIKDTADDLGAPGKDTFYGHGRINVAAAVNFAKPSRKDDKDSDSDSDDR